MKYDFDRIIDRRATHALKWDVYPDDVLPLWVADMDFAAPDAVMRDLHRRVDHGVFGYTRAPMELSGLFQTRMERLYGWPILAENLLYVPGVVSGLNIAIQAFTRPGEAVLVQPPVYFHFLSDPVKHGRTLADPALLRNQDSYEIDFDLFERSITAQTRLFVLCNPHNPVGRVFARSELERLAEICLHHRLIICSDEIHCDLLFPGAKHIPIATLSPEVARSTITLMAPSKTYNIAGLECAFAVIQNQELRQRWQATSYAIVPGVNLLGYAAALAALQDGQDWLTQALAYLTANRDFLQGALLRKIPKILMCRMEATYLAWLDCRQMPFASDPGGFFLREAKVALNDGADFGQAGQGYVRMNFACPRSILTEAIHRMAAACAKPHIQNGMR
jgi:cystathionine beta-lyase